MSLTPPRYTPAEMALADLRHAYQQLYDMHSNPRKIAVGLLGPSIEKLERSTKQAAGQARVLDRLRAWVNEYPNDRYTGQFWAQELERLLREEGVTA